jgi:hypothetical protein
MSAHLTRQCREALRRWRIQCGDFTSVAQCRVLERVRHKSTISSAGRLLALLNLFFSRRNFWEELPSMSLPRGALGENAYPFCSYLLVNASISFIYVLVLSHAHGIHCTCSWHTLHMLFRSPALALLRSITPLRAHDTLPRSNVFMCSSLMLPCSNTLAFSCSNVFTLIRLGDLPPFWYLL